MESSVQIPQVVYGNPLCRIVWYSHLSSADVPELNNALNASDTEVARRSLQALLQDARSTEGSGVTLETGGESDIAGMQWNKAIDAPAGVLSVSLHPRKDYLNLIQQDDVLLVFLQSSRNDREYFLTLVSVDTITESTTTSGNGATIVTVHVQGRDLGKVLMETPTVFDSAFGGLTISRFFAYFLNAFQAEVVFGGPSRVVQVMLSIFYSLRQNFVTLTTGQAVPSDVTVADLAKLTAERPLRLWGFPGHASASMLSFLDIKSFVQTPMVGSTTVPATLLQAQGNLWALCDMYANRLVNEMFIDVRDLVPGYDEAHKRHAALAQRILEGASSLQQTAGEQKLQSAQLDEALGRPVSDPTAADIIQLLQEQDATGHGLLLTAEDLDSIADDSDEASRAIQGDFNPKALSTDVPSVVALVHRQMPYDTLSFYSLPATVVYETEVMEAQLSKSTHDICNLFRIRFPGLVETVAGSKAVLQDQMFGVTINRESISQHGIRRFEGESIFPFVLDPKHGGAPDFRSTYEFYMSLVTCWYAYNERMYSGHLTIRPRPDIRVGTRLTYVRTHAGKQEVFDLYVQNVQQAFSPMPGQSRTSVEVVRGIKRAEGLQLGEQPEAGLFWSNLGRHLRYDPYEIVVSSDIQPGKKEGETVPTNAVDPNIGEDDA